MSHSQTWNTEQSAALYCVDGWSDGFFSINKKGDFALSFTDSDNSITFNEIARSLKESGHDLPALIRIPEILDFQLSKLHEAFRSKIKQANYGGSYTAYFPTKTNQQRAVLERIAGNHSDAYPLGLEIGTKPELLAALSTIGDRDIPIVCNGYKDSDYINFVLSLTDAGTDITLILERLPELDLLIRCLKGRNTRPKLGLRFRPYSKSAGYWKDSSGENGLFGFNSYEVFTAVERCRQNGIVDCIDLLHFHQGSQIDDIDAVKHGATEIASLYVQLHSEGLNLRRLNLGGGLGVDYRGSRSKENSSLNYALNDYVSTIIDCLKSTMDRNEVPHPDIITESGRAITAHHSMLIVEAAPNQFPDDIGPLCPASLRPELESLEVLSQKTEFDDPGSLIEEVNALLTIVRAKFNVGLYTAKEKAEAHRLRKLIDYHISNATAPNFSSEIPPTYYFGNFSVFQSISDLWAIDQIFPVIPLARLDERPTVRGQLADITCDCDGKLDRYQTPADYDPESNAKQKQQARDHIPLHCVRPTEKYLVGIFLVGAYQETLGDIHNLLGSVTIAEVVRKGQSFTVETTRPVETSDSLLKTVDHDPQAVKSTVRKIFQEAADNGSLSAEQLETSLNQLKHLLSSTPYLRLD